MYSVCWSQNLVTEMSNYKKQSRLLTSLLSSELSAFCPGLVHFVLLSQCFQEDVLRAAGCTVMKPPASFSFILIARMDLEGLCKCSYGCQEQDLHPTS